MEISPTSDSDGPRIRKNRRTAAEPQSRARRLRGSTMRAHHLLDDPTPPTPADNPVRTQLNAVGGSTSTSGSQSEATPNEEPGDFLAGFDSSSSRLSFSAKQPRPEARIPSTPAPPTFDTRLEISSTSASIKLKCLLGLSSAPEASSASTTAEPDRADLHKEPVLFMRLPAEIRVMIYKRTWAVVNCPWKMTVEADHRWRCTTGAKFWLGPNPMAQVLYPTIILEMDPRIKGEFLHELCAHFPLQMRLGIFFMKKIPDPSIHMPSTFEHLRECQVAYHPYKPSYNGLHIESFKKFEDIVFDVYMIVGLLQTFPSLRKALVYMQLHPSMVLSRTRSMLDVLEALDKTMDTPTLTERRVGSFAQHDDGEFLIGWVSGKEFLSGEYRSVDYLERLRASWRLQVHDLHRCDSGLCKARVKTKAIIDTIRRVCSSVASINTHVSHWLSQHRSLVTNGACVLVVLFCRLPEFTGPKTTHNFWHRIIYTLLLRHQVDNFRVCVGFLLLRNGWMIRDACYIYLQSILHAFATREISHAASIVATARRFGAPAITIEYFQKFQRGFQHLANISTPGQMAHASTHNRLLAKIWHCIKRLVSFFTDVFFGLAFQIYLHITAWIVIPILFNMPLLMLLGLPEWTTGLRDAVSPYFMFLGDSFVHTYLYPPDCDFSSEQPFHFSRILGCVLCVFLWPYISVHLFWQPIMNLRVNHLLEMSLARWRVVGDIRDFVPVARGAASWIAASIPTPAKSWARGNSVLLWALGFAVAMPIAKVIPYVLRTALARLLPAEIWETLFEILILLESFVCAWVWECQPSLHRRAA